MESLTESHPDPLTRPRPYLSLRFRLAALVTGVLAGAFALQAPVAFLVAGRSFDAAALWVAAITTSAAVLIADWAARRLVCQPLARVREAMRAAAGGQTSARAPVERPDEIGAVARELNRMLDNLQPASRSSQDRTDPGLREGDSQSAGAGPPGPALLSEELARAGRLAALGQATASVAHQIGTPLNLISGHVQLLVESAPADGPLSERLRIIQEQVTKLTAVVRATLESARRPSVPLERVSLTSVVNQVCRMARPVVAAAGVEVEVVTPDAPAETMADAVQLEMALLNLVTNSVDAMPSGGKLTFHLTRTGDDRLRLEVADTGSGIPADLGAHIFEPWVTTKAPGKGTGLGLSIVRQVIASHGGTIVARNRPGSGAVFTIELPDAAASRAIHSASDAANPDR